MKTIETKSAPAAIGPYSQAILANGFLYTSGQIPLSVSFSFKLRFLHEALYKISFRDKM